MSFPEESEEEFLQTKQFLQDVGFSDLHVFVFSKREGTVADKLYKDLPSEIKKERSKILTNLAETMKNNFINKNKFECVLFEEKEGEFFVGYSKNYIKCYLNSEEDLSNKILDVEILSPFKGGALAKLNIDK